MPNRDKTGPQSEGPRTGKGLGNCEEPKKEMRQLNDDEKKLINKSLNRYAKAKKYLEYQLKYYDLMINEGLEQNFIVQMTKMKQQRSNFETEIVSNDSIVETLNKQVVEGVKIKEKESEE